MPDTEMIIRYRIYSGDRFIASFADPDDAEQIAQLLSDQDSVEIRRVELAAPRSHLRPSDHYRWVEAVPRNRTCNCHGCRNGNPCIGEGSEIWKE